MLATRTCYYSRNQVFGGISNQDMSLIDICFCSQNVPIWKSCQWNNSTTYCQIWMRVFWINNTNTILINQAGKLTSKSFWPHRDLNSLHSNPNKWSVLFKESQFVHHFTHQEMRSEIDVEIVKIRGIIYQQNLGMDFESRVALSY